MWSVNTSVARVVITWTVLGLFFIWIVFAGTSSYECPFQTPASAALRYLKDSATTRKFVATPPRLRSSHHLVEHPGGARFDIPSRSQCWTRPILLGDFIVPHHSYDSQRDHEGRTPNHHSTSPNRSSIWERKAETGPRDPKIQAAGLLPITVEDAHHQQIVPRDSPGLRVRVRDLKGVRKRIANNARCVCWVLRNITDPEVIDSAIGLAGTIW